MDTVAADLRFALGLPALPALAEAVVAGFLGAGTLLRMRVLGASHQVVLEYADTRCSETVACLPATDAGPLERHVRATVGPWRYRMASQVHRLEDTELRVRVGRVRRELAGHPDALVAAFPGDPDAVTMLLAEPGTDAASWQTWHSYPGTGELVLTRTKVWWPR